MYYKSRTNKNCASYKKQVILRIELIGKILKRKNLFLKRKCKRFIGYQKCLGK